MSEQKTIAIIGGGISGLSAAYHVRQMQPTSRIVLFESNQHLGGVLKTECVDGFLIEHSADMFTVEPNDAFEFCRRLGHAAELITTQPVPHRAYIATETGIVPVPHGFSLMLPSDPQAVVNSGLLDADGVARFLQERNVPARMETSDESLESFAVRRFGHQVFERLIQPLVSGIYTADPKRLSMQATMSRFVAMERQSGSLLAAAETLRRDSVQTIRDSKKRGEYGYEKNQLTFADQTASGARYDLFRAPRMGMSQLIGWIVDELTDIEIKTSASVTKIEKLDSHWNLKIATMESNISMRFDGAILTLPARLAAPLVRESDEKLARKLELITAASCAVVVLGLDEQLIGKSFAGYGIVVPTRLNRNLIAVSFSSNKFDGRAPAGTLLLRAFIGGALQPELVKLSDEELVSLTLAEVGPTLGLTGVEIRRAKQSGDFLRLAKVYRWFDTMPQYQVGHLDLVAQIQAGVERHPGLELAGNSYNGVGIPVCLASGQAAAERMNQYLKNT